MAIEASGALGNQHRRRHRTVRTEPRSAIRTIVTDAPVPTKNGRNVEVERAKGIEPSSVVGWEGGLAATLPPQNRA